MHMRPQPGLAFLLPPNNSADDLQLLSCPNGISPDSLDPTKIRVNNGTAALGSKGSVRNIQCVVSNLTRDTQEKGAQAMYIKPIHPSNP